MMKRMVLVACLLTFVIGCQSETETEQPAPEQTTSEPMSQEERLRKNAPERRPSDAIMTIEDITLAAGESGSFTIDYYGVEPAKAMVVPLKFPNGFVVDSVSWSGSVVDYLANKPVRIANEENLLLMAAVPVTEDAVPPGEGLFATVYFHLAENAESGRIVETIAPPANQLSYVDTAKTLVQINLDGAEVSVQ
ncbi:MAG: hypothetical protein GF341_11350 [candidate division Zixibacteria bacterium]|nr:hypothetical protein [candidate division Zixibacteria bacterium]